MAWGRRRTFVSPGAEGCLESRVRVYGEGLPSAWWEVQNERVGWGASRPLPMLRGQDVASDRDIDPRPEQPQQQQPTQGRGESAVERILRDLLGGGNR